MSKKNKLHANMFVTILFKKNYSQHESKQKHIKNKNILSNLQNSNTSQQTLKIKHDF